jgi:hypothetical protein
VYTSGAPGQDRRVDDLEPPREPVAKLLARWGIPAGAAVAPTERGTNNRTLQMTAGLDAGRAGVLRDGADRAVAAWEGIAGRLPTQVVHADLPALADGRGRRAGNIVAAAGRSGQLGSPRR